MAAPVQDQDQGQDVPQGQGRPSCRKKKRLKKGASPTPPPAGLPSPRPQTQEDQSPPQNPRRLIGGETVLTDALVCVGTVNLPPREPWRSTRDLRARESTSGNIRGTTAQLFRAKKADAARKKKAAVKATVNRRAIALAARGAPPVRPSYRERQAAVREQRTPVLPDLPLPAQVSARRRPRRSPA